MIKLVLTDLDNTLIAHEPGAPFDEAVITDERGEIIEETGGAKPPVSVHTAKLAIHVICFLRR